MSASIEEHFSPLEDPRIDRNKRYELMDILTLVVCAVTAGATGWEAIEEFSSVLSQLDGGGERSDGG